MSGSEALAPVSAGERIEAMDVLRGFALPGILLMNIESFAGPFSVALTGLDPGLQGADRWVDALIYLLVQGKFWTLFSLLFGMGFAVMMHRAEAAGRPFAGLYLRRTLVLLVLGIAHALLLWPGDILAFYAATALVLLLCFRRTPVSRLPLWGVGLYLAPMLLIFLMGLLAGLAQLMPEVAKEMAADAELARAGFYETVQAQRAAYGSGRFAEVTAQRAADFGEMVGYYLMMMLPMALGMFLLGVWFLRSGAIARPQDFPRLYSRLRGAGLLAGLVAVLIAFWLSPTVIPGEFNARIGSAFLLGTVGSLLLCLAYLAWVLRGLQSKCWAPRLAMLAPAGRMALSNYLMQSLVCTSLFYGYGLGYFEQLPRAWQPLFVLVLFALQLVLSRWWLARFRFGPMEWLWRALTYLQLPPMRRAGHA